jgi:cytidylate kinase
VQFFSNLLRPSRSRLEVEVMSFVIAIDGPAASGKSSVSRVLAEKLGAIFVNSGAMYRAVTWAALEADIDPTDAAAVAAWVAELKISCGQEQGHSTIRINGQDPEPHIREPRVNAAVSAISAVPEVRQILVDNLRSYARLGNIVMEGRDIGSVVFPDTPHKFYVDASEEVRAKRREAQGETDSIAKRDAQDSSRKTAPLKVAADAIVVDSSEMSLEQVVQALWPHLATRGLSLPY